MTCHALLDDSVVDGTVDGSTGQALVEDAELDELIEAATGGDPSQEFIDYNAFITKILAL